jgi:protein-ribulosamine 3-kinase
VYHGAFEQAHGGDHGTPGDHRGGDRPGCINTTTVLEGGGRRYFVKLNDAERQAMFEAEAEGLEAIRATAAIRAPRPICRGVAQGSSYLVLEHIAFGRGKADSAARLGHELAAVHRAVAPRFGWHRDNTIGSTPQANAWCEDWVTFFRDRRLGAQLALAARNGHGGRLQARGERLLADLGVLLAGHAPEPSLLHGDLWAGNYASDAEGHPVIFDPAVYHGDREADLAMTELFGGFPSGFYAAYREAWPLDAGYRVRRDLYNLYHVLNHLNLFGGGYRGQAEHLIDRLLAEVA